MVTGLRTPAKLYHMKSLLKLIPLLLTLSIPAAYSQKPNQAVEVKAQNNIYV